MPAVDFTTTCPFDIDHIKAFPYSYRPENAADVPGPGCRPGAPFDRGLTHA